MRALFAILVLAGCRPTPSPATVPARSSLAATAHQPVATRSPKETVDDAEALVAAGRPVAGLRLFLALAEETSAPASLRKRSAARALEIADASEALLDAELIVRALDASLALTLHRPETRLTLRLRRARLLWRTGAIDRARPDLVAIIAEHPADRLAEYAANILLDGLVAADRLDEVAAEVDRMLANNALLLAHRELGERLRSLKSKVSRARAESLAAASDFEACGHAYLQLFANGGPDVADADELLYNAGVCYERAALTGVALTAYRRLIEAHPRSPLAERALFRSGALYASIAAYHQAAESFESYARRYAGSVQAPAALREATRYRVAIGDARQATKNAETFNALYSRKLRRESAEIFWLAIRDDVADSGALAAQLDRYIRLFGGLDRTAVVRARAKLGVLSWEQSCPRKTVMLCTRRRESKLAVRAASLIEVALRDAAQLSDGDRARLALELDAAALALADRAAERELRKANPNRPALAAAYEVLAAQSSTASAPVAWIRAASLLGEPDKLGVYRRCRDQAAALHLAPSSAAICDQNVYLADPSAARPRERRGALAAGDLVSGQPIIEIFSPSSVSPAGAAAETKAGDAEAPPTM